MLVKHWRSQAIRIFGFIDDLSNSGFVCNMVKSQWLPGQVGEHLGFVVNFKEGTFSVTEKRKSKLMSKLDFISGVTQPTARAIASLSGCILSMLLVVGPVARLRTHAMHSLAELEFWLTRFDKYNGFPIWPTSPVVDVLSFSDASDFVWGVYLVKIGKNIAKGVFSEAEANSSSTWRELKATLYVLESLCCQPY